MSIEMADLLQLVIDEGASDLHLPVGSPPVLRLHGDLTPLDTDPMVPEDTERLMKAITSEVNQQKLQEDGGVDFGFAFGTEPDATLLPYNRRSRPRRPPSCAAICPV